METNRPIGNGMSEPNPLPMPNQPVGKCSKCGIDLYSVMGYVCPRIDCTVFVKTIC